MCLQRELDLSAPRGTLEISCKRIGNTQISQPRLLAKSALLQILSTVTEHSKDHSQTTLREIGTKILIFRVWTGNGYGVITNREPLLTESPFY